MFSATRNKSKVGKRVLVEMRDDRRFTGKLLELDDQNLVIETRQGYEEIFRVTTVADVRLIGSERVALQ